MKITHEKLVDLESAIISELSREALAALGQSTESTVKTDIKELENRAHIIQECIEKVKEEFYKFSEKVYGNL